MKLFIYHSSVEVKRCFLLPQGSCTMKLNSSSELMVSQTHLRMFPRAFSHISWPSSVVLELVCLSSCDLNACFLSVADHLEGVCQHPPVRASGPGRRLPEAVPAAGEGPLWGDGLRQHLLPAKQVQMTHMQNISVSRCSQQQLIELQSLMFHSGFCS